MTLEELEKSFNDLTLDIFKDMWADYLWNIISGKGGENI